MIRDGPGYASASAMAFTVWLKVSAHSDLRNVYVSVAHCDRCQVFLLNILAACSELSNRAYRSSLGGLSAGGWNILRYRIPLH